MKTFASIILSFFLIGCFSSKENVFPPKISQHSPQEFSEVTPASVSIPMHESQSQSHWNVITWILLGSIVICCFCYLPNLKNKISKFSDN